MVQNLIKIIAGLAFLLSVTACAPTVKVATPEEPITINVSISLRNLDTVKVDKDLDELMTKDSGLF